MKHSWKSIRSALLVALLTAVTAQAGNNRAVIIGVNDYLYLGQLEYCVADAKALRDQLIRGGEFDAGSVILMTDDAPDPRNRPALANIKRRLSGLKEQPGETGTLLVYFAGHGILDDQQRQWLIPIDGDQTTALEISWVRGQLAASGADNPVLILDCCHAGKGVRGVSRIAPRLVAGAGVAVIASCDDKQQSYDVPEKGHGVFSLFLTAGLAGEADSDDDQRVCLPELFKYVSDGVSGWAFRKNLSQTPVLLADAAATNVCLARVRPAAEIPSVVLPPVSAPEPELPALPAATGGSLDEWEKSVAECEKALLEARKLYTPTSRHVKDAERNFLQARAGLRQAVLTELLQRDRLRLQALTEQQREMAKDMRPAHPNMKKLAVEIVKVREKIGALSGCLRAKDFRNYSFLLTVGLATWPFDALSAKFFQKAVAEQLGVPVERQFDLGGGVKMAMVLIPPGEFMMGSNKDGRAQPVHRVNISKAFYLGKYEMTQAQWQAVMGKSVGEQHDLSGSTSKLFGEGDTHPIYYLNWDECTAFAAKLGAGFRLPTEAEWEYACRAGTVGKYAGELDAMAWHVGNSSRQTHEVGRKRPNAWGLYDMHGNVWEWCADWYGDYPTGAVTDPTGPEGGSSRVFRGGSWYDTAWGCRSAYRRGDSPGYRGSHLGFRLLRTVP
jgi:formylglycine-generating enzyme required for sulfatase activity